MGDLPATGIAWNTPPAALNPHAQPGWSFYTFAWNPLAGAGVVDALRALNGTPFAASEWLYMGTNGTGVAQWAAAVNATIPAPPTGLNGRAVHVYNWGTVKGDTNALAGIREVVRPPHGSP